jgi:ribonuclease HI
MHKLHKKNEKETDMKFSIEFVYKHPKTSLKVHFTSEPMTLEEALFTVEDLEKTGRMNEINFIDSKDVSWSKKELVKLTKIKEEEPQQITLYFDGGFETETRKSGLGIVITYLQNNLQYRLKKNSHIVNIESNNEAEYAALWLAASELADLGVQYEEVTIKGDSKVVIEQMKGEWPCYEQNLQRWAGKIEEIFKKQKIEPVYEWISRKENKEADHLAQQAINGKSIKAVKEVIEKAN